MRGGRALWYTYLYMIGSLPIHDSINLILLLTFASSYVLLIAWGSWKQRAKRENELSDKTFPLPLDYILAGGYLAFFVFSSLSGLAASAESQAQEVALSWWDNLLIFGITLPIYIRLIGLWKRQSAPTLPWGKIVGFIFAGLFLVWSCNLLVQVTGLMDFFVNVCGAPLLQEAVVQLQNTPCQENLALIFAACILYPILEECLFRGLIYPCLKKYSTPLKAALICGLLFGALHMALTQMIGLSVLGIYLCFIYEKTQRLWVPIVLHMLVNTATIILIYNVPSISCLTPA